MEREMIERINELARKAKQGALTDDERAEQQALRARYLAEFREGMEQTLSALSIQEPDGTVHPVRKRDDAPEEPLPET